MADGQIGFGFLTTTATVAATEAPAERPLTREQRRSRRAREVRARTVSIVRMTKAELEMGRLMYPETDNGRPKTRAECPPVDPDGKRRCPFVSCAHHLYLDVSPKTGAIKLNYPDIEDPGEIPECCTLDVAEQGGKTLEQTGAIMNLTRERIRQLEVSAVDRLRDSDDDAADALIEWAQAAGLPGARGEKAPRRRLPLLQDRPDAVDEPGPVDDLDDEHTDAGGRGLFGERPGEAVALRAPAPKPQPDVPFDRRERALLRTAERLGRFTAAALARACGMPGDEWAVASLVARGLLRRDGGELVATEELARLVRNGYRHSEAAE